MTSSPRLAYSSYDYNDTIYLMNTSAITNPKCYPTEYCNNTCDPIRQRWRTAHYIESNHVLIKEM